MTLNNADDHSELHEGNTLNAARKLSLTEIHMHDLALDLLITLKLSIFILIMMLNLTRVHRGRNYLFHISVNRN